MKLTVKKVRWLVRRKSEGMRSRDVAWALKVSRRRVNQVWRIYRETGEAPVIGVDLGRPKTSVITPDERRMIVEAKARYKLVARRLEPIIERDYGVHIPHNRVHRCLLEEGLAREVPNKKRRRKWIRYERRCSLSAAHMDWHDGVNETKVCAIQDDASRDILVWGEFDAENTENSTRLFEKLVEEYWGIRPLRELIIDHGSPFGAHRTDEKGDWDSVFKRLVEAHGTRIIRASVGHPQTNGKIEKWYDLYEKHRRDFPTFDEFIDWYRNIRPHESLDTRYLETPREAFWRKLPPECLLGAACRLFGW